MPSAAGVDSGHPAVGHFEEFFSQEIDSKRMRRPNLNDTEEDRIKTIITLNEIKLTDPVSVLQPFQW